jgi:bacterioferritin-associated ferredoxin
MRTIITCIKKRGEIMYVCLCKGIKDTDIQEVIREHGAGNLRDVKKHLPVGQDCGNCTKLAQSVIDNFIIDESLFKEVS